VENYLKPLGIANPNIHISLCHDRSIVWTKPSVQNIDQSIITVLGVNFASKLCKSGPIEIETTDIQNTSKQEEDGKKSELVAFFPRKPIDMKTMSFTLNKLLIVLVNRKRVVVKEFEKVSYDLKITISISTF